MVFIYSRACDKFPSMAIFYATCESLERDILFHFFFNTFSRDEERALLYQLNMIRLLDTIHESRSVVYHYSRGVHDQNAKVKRKITVHQIHFSSGITPLDLNIGPRSLSLTGFVRNKSTPLTTASRCASSEASPVRASIRAGLRPCRCSNALILRVASKPSMMGIEMSIKMQT